MPYLSFGRASASGPPAPTISLVVSSYSILIYISTVMTKLLMMDEFELCKKGCMKSTCVRRPKYIIYIGGDPSGYIPTYITRNTISSESMVGNMWTKLSSWIPCREVLPQSKEENSRFPGRVRTLSAPQTKTGPTNGNDSSLQARLLESGNSPVHPSSQDAIDAGQQRNNRRIR